MDMSDSVPFSGASHNQPGEDELQAYCRNIPQTARPDGEAAQDQKENVSDTMTSLQLVEALRRNQTHECQVERERKALEAQVKTSCVMIVDDEEVVVRTVRQHLAQAGYENFVTTMDSREVMKLAEKAQPDLILLDIKMPHVTGLEILRFLKLDPVLRNVPVLILTGSSNPVVKKRLWKWGRMTF